MEPADVWGTRWDVCDNTLARHYMEVACRKQTLVILAADLNTMAGLRSEWRSPTFGTLRERCIAVHIAARGG